MSTSKSSSIGSCLTSALGPTGVEDCEELTIFTPLGVDGVLPEPGRRIQKIIGAMNLNSKLRSEYMHKCDGFSLFQLPFLGYFGGFSLVSSCLSFLN